MKISTRGRYGLRAMLELARRHGRRPVPLGELAAQEGLSRKYLHNLLTRLKAAGLVRSVLGAGGGFVLTRPPSEIRIREVFLALEGPISLVACVGDEDACEKTGACDARCVWQDLSKAIETVLDGFTLEDPIRSRCIPASLGDRGVR